MTKAVIKGKSDISVEKMKEIRKIPKDIEIDYSKVSLGLKSHESYPSYSCDIIDKAKYDFEIGDISQFTFCQNGQCVITVDFEKANFTNEYDLTLYFENLTGRCLKFAPCIFFMSLLLFLDISNPIFLSS